MRKLQIEQIEEIIKMYSSGDFLTEDISKKFDISTKTILRYAKRYGVARTNMESNKLISKLKDYSSLKKAINERKQRGHITQKRRYEILSMHPYCALCGGKPPEVWLQVDHKDANPSNNSDENLQVLCRDCNYGKKETPWTLEQQYTEEIKDSCQRRFGYKLSPSVKLQQDGVVL